VRTNKETNRMIEFSSNFVTNNKKKLPNSRHGDDSEFDMI